MRRSLLGLGLALLAACLLMAAIGGLSAVVKSVEILLPVGAVALLAAHAADARRLRLRTLRERFHFGVGLAIAQLLAAVLIAAWLMFVSEEDAWTTVGIVVFAAVVSATAGQVILRGGPHRRARGRRRASRGRARRA